MFSMPSSSSSSSNQRVSTVFKMRRASQPIPNSPQSATATLGGVGGGIKWGRGVYEMRPEPLFACRDATDTSRQGPPSPCHFHQPASPPLPLLPSRGLRIFFYYSPCALPLYIVAAILYVAITVVMLPFLFWRRGYWEGWLRRCGPLHRRGWD